MTVASWTHVAATLVHAIHLALRSDPWLLVLAAAPAFSSNNAVSCRALVPRGSAYLTRTALIVPCATLIGATLSRSSPQCCTHCEKPLSADDNTTGCSSCAKLAEKKRKEDARQRRQLEKDWRRWERDLKKREKEKLKAEKREKREFENTWRRCEKVLDRVKKERLMEERRKKREARYSVRRESARLKERGEKEREESEQERSRV